MKPAAGLTAGGRILFAPRGPAMRRARLSGGSGW